MEYLENLQNVRARYHIHDDICSGYYIHDDICSGFRSTTLYGTSSNRTCNQYFHHQISHNYNWASIQNRRKAM